jgi:hypothetical protein
MYTIAGFCTSDIFILRFTNCHSKDNFNLENPDNKAGKASAAKFVALLSLGKSDNFKK